MRQLSLSLIVVVLAAIVGLGWVINAIYIHTNTDESVQPELASYLDFGRELADTVDAIDDPDAFLARWNHDNRFQATIFEREHFPLPESLQADFISGRPIILEHNAGLEAHYLMPASDAVLAVALPQPEEAAPKSRYELLLTLVFYGGVTSILLIWIWPLIHNLNRLRQVAKRFGQGELHARVHPGKFSYIRDIENEFNHMATRIEQLIEDNKLLSRAVSHDLKTPLSRLRFGLEALSDTSDAALKEKYARRVNADLEDMESLIDTLLQFARLDEANIQLQIQPISLANLVEVAAEQIVPDALSCTIELTENTEVLADQRYLSMLVNNLLTNASRHANTQIQIVFEVQGERVWMHIDDDGLGLPEKDRANALKPFWRGSASRQRKGHGMGLAIVDRIAQWLKGGIHIGVSPTLGGARFSVQLPRAV